jgi:hypothetical protein
MKEEGYCSFKALTEGSVRMTSPTALSLKMRILGESIFRRLPYCPIIFNSQMQKDALFKQLNAKAVQKRMAGDE